MADFNDLYALQQRLASPMLNIQVAQAQAPRPLGAPAPFNNAPTSTGLLLDQMNRFSDMRAAQAQQDIENENARRVQELQMMTFQAELAQQEQARQARENLAAQEGFSPMQRAAILAGYGEEVVKSAFAPEKVSNAMRVYQEAGGVQGTGMDFFEFLKSEAAPGGGVTINTGQQFAPPPKGMVRVSDPGSPTGTKLIPEVGAPGKGLTPEERAAADYRKQADFALAGLDRLEQLIDQYGTEPAPGGGRAPMESAVERAVLTAKDVLEMGALQGQERQMLESLIGNPTEAMAGVKGVNAYKAKLREARQMIEDKRRIYGTVGDTNQTPAPPPGTVGDTNQTPAPPPGFVMD